MSKAIRFKLREKRIAAGLTQNELSSLTGVSQSTISSIELNQNNVSFGAIFRICRSLGISLDAIAEEIDNKESEGE